MNSQVFDDLSATTLDGTYIPKPRNINDTIGLKLDR